MAKGACMAKGGMRGIRRDTEINERTVRILLECILMLVMTLLSYSSSV